MSYPTKAWVENTPVEGKDGGTFEIIAEAGYVVKSIRIFRRHDKKDISWIRGIQVRFSNDKSSKTGTCDDDSKFEDYTFDTTKLEKIESFSLWGMGTAKWEQTRKLKFSTNKGTNYSIGWPRSEKQQEYKMDVGSGILIGFKGNSGGEIDSVTPIFLKPLKKQYIDNVTYPTLDLNNTEFLSIESLDRGKAEWTGASYKFQLFGEHQVNTTTTWNRKFTIEAGLELKFTANAIFAKGETMTSLKLGGQFDQGGSESKTKLLRWNIEKQINGPYDTIEATATYWTGALDVDYKGTYNVVLENGEKFSFPTEGTVKQLVCSETIQTVRPLAGNPLLKENRELEDNDAQNEDTEAQENGPEVDENGEPLAVEPGTRYDENGSWIGDEPKDYQEDLEDDQKEGKENEAEQHAEADTEEREAENDNAGYTDETTDENLNEEAPYDQDEEPQQEEACYQEPQEEEGQQEEFQFEEAPYQDAENRNEETQEGEVRQEDFQSEETSYQENLEEEVQQDGHRSEETQYEQSKEDGLQQYGYQEKGQHEAIDEQPLEKYQPETTVEEVRDEYGVIDEETQEHSSYW